MQLTKKFILLSSLFLLAACSGSSGPKGTLTAKSEASLSYTSTPTAVSSFSAGVLFSSNTPEPTSGDPTGFVFDLYASGYVDDGYNDSIDDAFDSSSYLNIASGDDFPSNSYFPDRAANDTTQAYVEDVDGDSQNDQLVLLATTNAGLQVKRKIYVAPTFNCTVNGAALATACGWARYLDCFTNPTATDITLTPSLEGDFGSDGSGTLLGTANGTDSLDAPYYFAESDTGESDPNVGYVLGHADSALMPVLDIAPDSTDYYEFNWGGQAILAGQQSCFMHYIILGNRLHDNIAGDNATSDMMGLVRYFYETSPRTGILPSEDQAIRNFTPGIFSVVGEEEAAPENTLLTITNTVSSASTTATSDATGAFSAYVACNAGDKITVTAASGFSRSVNCE